MNIQEFEIVLNAWGKEKTPFFFVIDFELEHPFACRLEDAKEQNILFEILGFTNHSLQRATSDARIIKHPISFSEYKIKFDEVIRQLRYGNSFLTNLTIKTKIETDRTLRELFSLARAKYKLLFKDNFLVFSPETFVRIIDGKIYTFPMKGTIDAAIPNAREIILNDPKELAEHVTIVDLMRNDLSAVATQINVTRFRYIDELKTTHKNLLQVSSEIEGQLPENYLSKLGTLLIKLLPAGSISGAPKKNTIHIINSAEQEKRKYYTGVFGYFDGARLESAVMIRYIEKLGNEMYYRSGGGITALSNAKDEYQEAIDKIYVPVD